MSFLKSLFNDDEQAVGLCRFKKYFAHKVYNRVQGFNATKLVYSTPNKPRLNMFANS